MGFGRRDRKERNQGATFFDVEGKAMRYLSQRDHSEGEMRRKLRNQGYPEEHIEAVVTEYLELGYINDTKTAEGIVRVLMRQRWGPAQIRAKMRKREFRPETIDAALEEHELDEDVWIEAARERVTSKFRKEPSEFDQGEKEKAFRHLMYRGYSGNHARKVLF